MNEATSIVFEMEEASVCAMNDGVSNTHGIEEAPTGAESSNADTHYKLLKLTFPKVAMTRKGVASTCTEQMMILDQMDPKHLKDYPETKEDCHTHVRKHCNTLMQIP